MKANWKTTFTDQWILDGKINLTEIAKTAELHRLSMIEELQRLGVQPRREAEAFADFIGACICGEYELAHVTDEQYKRLEVH